MIIKHLKESLNPEIKKKVRPIYWWFRTIYYSLKNQCRPSTITYQIYYLISIGIYLLRKKSIFITKHRLKSVWRTRIDASQMSTLVRKFKFSGPSPSRFVNENDQYILYDYPVAYLKQVFYDDDFDRGSVSTWIEKNLGELIRKNLCAQYEIMHIWIYKTPAIGNNETFNLNSNFHRDSDKPGSLKFIVYLSDVDESNGPFQYIVKDKTHTVIGTAGETIFFKSFVYHAGSNTKKKDRYALSVLCYPTTAKEPILPTSKKTPPFNALCKKNPFK
jgi:hypothetical protein